MNKHFMKLIDYRTVIYADTINKAIEKMTEKAKLKFKLKFNEMTKYNKIKIISINDKYVCHKCNSFNIRKTKIQNNKNKIITNYMCNDCNEQFYNEIRRLTEFI